jgi:hypothetical protein
MPTSYIGGKVPKLIVQDVFRNISRYSCAKKKYHSRYVDPTSACLQGEYHSHWTIETSKDSRIRRVLLCQQTIFLINLGIFHRISWNVGAQKNLSYFWKSFN